MPLCIDAINLFRKQNFNEGTSQEDSLTGKSPPTRYLPEQDTEESDISDILPHNSDNNFIINSSHLDGNVTPTNHFNNTSRRVHSAAYNSSSESHIWASGYFNPGTGVIKDNGTSDQTSSSESSFPLSLHELQMIKMIVLCVVMTVLVLTASRMVLKTFSRYGGKPRDDKP